MQKLDKDQCIFRAYIDFIGSNAWFFMAMKIISRFKTYEKTKCQKERRKMKLETHTINQSKENLQKKNTGHLITMNTCIISNTWGKNPPATDSVIENNYFQPNPWDLLGER